MRRIMMKMMKQLLSGTAIIIFLLTLTGVSLFSNYVPSEAEVIDPHVEESEIEEHTDMEARERVLKAHEERMKKMALEEEKREAEQKAKEEKKKKSKPVLKESKTYYVTAPSGLNMRKKPDRQSKQVKILTWAKKIKAADYTDYKNQGKWVAVLREGKVVGYVNKKYISTKKPKYQDFYVGGISNFTYKSYTDYRSITSTDTSQWKLQQIAYTGSHGVRQVDGRYCLAIGTGFGCKVGQYFDVILKDGTVLPCIMCDEKDNSDTDGDNMYTVDNNCISEFYVYTPCISSLARKTGDMGRVPEFSSPVKIIRIYKKSAL